jgi:hypothetical protein
MNYVIQMGLGAVIQTSSFIKIGSCIQKLIGGGGNTQTHTYTQREQDDLICLFLFFKNKESRIKWSISSALQQ